MNIKIYKQEFDKWFKANPKTGLIAKEELLLVSGIDDEKDLICPRMSWNECFAKIPIKDLCHFGTGCGEQNNRPFTPKVICFLRNEGVKFILVITGNIKPEISAALMPIKYGKTTEKFSLMIGKNGGSLRDDGSGIKGWSSYESE